ncbi:MAG TPA: hypothetical protein DDW87_08290 [Firmicutes bacterium]|mgnify:CR=1 FL=1|nr:hypothetical protein [Bacillota bacterium]
MASFVYETVVDCQSSGELLLEIRQTVERLRSSHPELKHCCLGDVSLRKSKAAVNVTLFFHPEC